MTVTIYHEINSTSLEEIQKEGIKKSVTGNKDDREKAKIDNFLDTHLPEGAPPELSRRQVVYGYLSDGDKIVDITDGEPVDVQDYAIRSKRTLLKISVDPKDCYVSDLDLYDTMKRALQLDEQDSTREHLADRYWQRLIPLAAYEPGTIKRPEVLVTTDIQPDAIEVVSTE